MWYVPESLRTGQEKMSMKLKIEESNIEEFQMDMENRIRNLLWTISGDYSQEMKPDVTLF